MHQGHTCQPALNILNGTVQRFYSFPDINIHEAHHSTASFMPLKVYFDRELRKEALHLRQKGRQGTRGRALHLTWAELGTGDRNWEDFPGLTPWHLSKTTMAPPTLLWPHVVLIARGLALATSRFLHQSCRRHFCNEKIFLCLLNDCFLIF